MFQQIHEQIQSYTNAGILEHLEAGDVSLQEKDLLQQIENEPDLLQKLQEFCKNEDREQLIQKISQNDLMQLCQWAEQLQRT